MTKITTFITQGYTPPYVKIFEVKLSNSFLQVSNSVDGIPTLGSDDILDQGSIWG